MHWPFKFKLRLYKRRSGTSFFQYVEAHSVFSAFKQHRIRFLVMCLVARKGNRATKNSVTFTRFTIHIGPVCKAYYVPEGKGGQMGGKRNLWHTILSHFSETQWYTCHSVRYTCIFFGSALKPVKRGTQVHAKKEVPLQAVCHPDWQ